jgi:hypothetical protein
MTDDRTAITAVDPPRVRDRDAILLVLRTGTGGNNPTDETATPAATPLSG